jgi:hypothetical protein
MIPSDKVSKQADEEQKKSDQPPRLSVRNNYRVNN